MSTAAPTRRSTRAPLRRLAPEMLKFGTVGLLGVAVNLAVFNICHGLHWAPGRSGVLATLVAIGVNYVGYRYWVYRDRDAAARSREITLFLVFSAVGLVIENGSLYISEYGLGYHSSLSDNVAKFVVGLPLGTLFRFISYRTWVFKTLPEVKPQQQGPAEAGAEDGSVAQSEVVLAVQPARRRSSSRSRG